HFSDVYLTLKMFNIKPRPNDKPLDPVSHRSFDVTDDVAVLNDRTKEAAHRSSLIVCWRSLLVQAPRYATQARGPAQHYPHGAQLKAHGVLVAILAPPASVG